MNHKGFLLAVLAPWFLTVATVAAEVRGVISKVDLDKREVVVEGRGRGARGQTFTFRVDKDTRILFGQDPGELADLAAGKHVRVSFEHQGGQDVALLIQAHGSPAPRTTTSKPMGSGDGITGTLMRVALTEREMVVVGPGPKGPETETTIAVPDRAQVTRGDQTIRFDELKEGEQVAVTAEKRDGKLTAVAIHAGGGKPPAAPAGKEARLQKVMQIVGQVLQQLEQMRANRR
jgi:Cu/Ag efflux protein CusF